MVAALSRRGFLVGAALTVLPRVSAAQMPGKIVTLEWAETEMVLSLGLIPSGVADLAGYRQWVGIDNEALIGTLDVGGRQQPSLEALMRLKPDLIVTSALRHATIAARLRAIAPTLLLDAGANEADFYEATKSDLSTVATATDRAAIGKAEWRSFEERLVAVRKRNRDSVKLIVAQPLPGVARLRIFTSNSLIMKTLAKAGFSIGGDFGTQPFGFTTIGLEELATLSVDTKLLMLGEAVPNELIQSAIWPVLPVVAAKQVYAIGGDIWPFGSTRSMARLVEKATSALAI
ncbi:iron-siderophore ABC transporter substrate-binding protein [Ochrobactrum sp. AN78]|uniref:iron-siderophore ABC transporter substrate-binding protein n=1 Tax=Ochrobactrum sp. AN78 TaxID=3039853 RepID=UPI002989A007|nr:iron-siderophore ABC transporter substrate-binding protein [Ochrobactrum sp. AN78]MDH7792584.1 ABC-type Fe3+-citrate transport system substrate-binding protein [Ochrobactrum sp. AN78]